MEIRDWLVRCFLLSLLLVAGCQSETRPFPNQHPPTTATAVSRPTTAISPTATPQPSPSTPTPLPTATPAPLPAYTLAVPEQWLNAVETAVSQQHTFTIIPYTATNPAAELANGQADIALIPGDNGQPAIRQPLAFAVPFTTEWETTTAEFATEVMQNGHNLITVLPWNAMPPTHKALRINGQHPLDEGYPFVQTWSLQGHDGTETAVSQLTPLFQTAATPPTLHLAAVGDIMLARALGQAITQGSIDYPFAQFAASLQTADLTIGNMESALGDTGTPASKRYPFQAPPAAAQSLANAGFDLVSLANNHAMDYGAEALLQAIALLNEQGVTPIGAGANEEAAHTPAVVQKNGITLAFLAYVNVPVESSTGFDTATWTATAVSPGLAWADPDRIRQDVAAIAPTVDHTIVVLHSGYEYIAEPSPPQIAAAHAAIEAGASLVIGHHAHILQGIEFYQDGIILYGTGNFAFQITGDPETAVFHIWLDKEQIREIGIQPAIIQADGQPRPALPEEAAQIRQRLYWLTTILNPQ